MDDTGIGGPAPIPTGKSHGAQGMRRCGSIIIDDNSVCPQYYGYRSNKGYFTCIPDTQFDNKCADRTINGITIEERKCSVATTTTPIITDQLNKLNNFIISVS